MIQLHQTPRFLESIYPTLVWRRQAENELFLTFDDGPHPEITDWVLQQLAVYHAKATFFCVGDNLRKFTSVAKETVDQGHLLANHTQYHSKGWKTPNPTYFDGVEACELEIVKIQQSSKKLFRPPYGRIKKSQIQELNREYEVIMWSHLSWDFDRRLDVGKSLKSLKKARSGSIIVFHDSEKSFENLKQILPEMLNYWSSLKYQFSTL